MAGSLQREERSSLIETLIGAVTGLTFKLGVVSALIVSALVTLSAVYLYTVERDHLLEWTQQTASTQARLTLTGLDFAMLENNRGLLQQLVDEYARSAEVKTVFLADATGNVVVSSNPDWNGVELPLPADICPTCVSGPDPTRVELLGDTKVLRSLTAVPNRTTCHRCHPEQQRTLGVLGVDFSGAHLAEARVNLVKRIIVWSVGVSVLVLLAEWAVVYLGVLRRLRPLRDATRGLGPDAEAGATKRDEIRAIAEGIDRQQRFLVELIDKMDDGVGVVDGERKVVAANQSYLRRMRATREQVTRGELRCGALSVCGLAGESDCPTRRAFRSGRLEKRIQRHEETDTFEEVFASPILGPEGRVELVVETWRDVTQRVALQANLARSEQLAAVGTLATGFSHEISTPLGTVSTLIQGLQRSLRERERVEGAELAELRGRLELASHEVFRCHDITRSLLDLGRARRTVRDRVDFAAVLGRMLEVVRPTAEGRAVKVGLVRGEGLPKVLGHVDQLEQVMLNLYMNAIEAMPSGGELGVTARSDAGGVEVLVADSGPGVPHEDAERVFEPFFTRKAGGTGLGLYVSRQIVEAHGGRLELAAAGPGARFRLFLPAPGDDVKS